MLDSMSEGSGLVAKAANSLVGIQSALTCIDLMQQDCRGLRMV